MHPRRHPAAAAVLVFLGLLVLMSGCAPATKPEVRLEVVKLAEFEAAVARHKGKVVVVDFWATFCTPCMKEFHRTVEMQQKYGQDGLVCISMSVDQPQDRDSALKFLQKEKAEFENFLIDEEASIWSNAWKFRNVPAVRVYGRDGMLAKQFDYEDPDNQFEHKDVEPFVVKLLRDGK